MIPIINLLLVLFFAGLALFFYKLYQKEKAKYPYPVAFHTVDIALWRPVNGIPLYEVCMGQKPNELGTGLWRFPGGFVDPELDKSAEEAALRECREEVEGPEIDLYPKYITSMLTNDPRYRDRKDKILTSFYKIKYIFGVARHGDDLAAVTWLPINEETLSQINPIHKELFQALINDFKTA